ncbi:hypothetical protein NMY22_g11567 [Coprinellus aureogranulatus]|nr:hypothetical protein NMY22_g11567 [Coprinellus aureogranulatus]
MVDLSMIPTHLLESPPKPLPDRLWELEFPRKDTTPNDRKPIHLAPFLHRRAPGRETLPAVRTLLEDCAEANNDTPLPLRVLRPRRRAFNQPSPATATSVFRSYPYAS